MRVHVKMLFAAFSFDLYQLSTLRKKGVYLAEVLDKKMKSR